ncbi:gamma carbonic anhydrase family protein [Sphingorhabdus lutea]|uniref:Gamma carbonic anhydrase family protein n=1 Tax=Sphingorhabdus lutea TaxID=1913578 RepID=A0A1L3JDS1_9SPHN|nr:gamma carbonic anhydrase family protein [Sphingorhabdus lutea]APG63291.1 gamma carbonic anhydrase family protein [Sphingorhabdus lutea]
MSFDHSVSIITINGKTPTIHPSAFIAPGCRIIGDVSIGADVSIWYNCVLRADVSHIAIGNRSNIQDGSIIHCDGPDGLSADGYPTIIGEDVLVGHKAIIHGSHLHDRAFVGMAASTMNGCVIEGDAMLAAGALLTPGKKVNAKTLWAGAPARMVRDLSEEDILGMRAGVAHYVFNGHAHKLAVSGE